VPLQALSRVPDFRSLQLQLDAAASIGSSGGGAARLSDLRPALIRVRAFLASTLESVHFKTLNPPKIETRRGSGRFSQTADYDLWFSSRNRFVCIETIP
jgi:hypothetical protein